MQTELLVSPHYTNSWKCAPRHSDDVPMIPQDPRYWTRADVSTWLEYTASSHGLPPVRTERFAMNGKALCLMTVAMFLDRVPLGGKLLYKDFQLRLSRAMHLSSIQKNKQRNRILRIGQVKKHLKTTVSLARKL